MDNTPVQAPSPTGSALTISEETSSFVIRVFAVTISGVLFMIVGVLCLRVALDGNSAVTTQVTQSLAGIVPWLAGTLVAAIVGAKAIAAFVTSKLGV